MHAGATKGPCWLWGQGIAWPEAVFGGSRALVRDADGKCLTQSWEVLGTPRPPAPATPLLPAAITG